MRVRACACVRSCACLRVLGRKRESNRRGYALGLTIGCDKFKIFVLIVFFLESFCWHGSQLRRQTSEIFSSYSQVSISSTFYDQLLHAQILKAQKRQPSCQSFFVLLGSAHVKAGCITLMKLSPVY